MREPTHARPADVAPGALVSLVGSGLVGVVTVVGPDGYLTVEVCCDPAALRAVELDALVVTR